jgi:hypothetical protein
MKILVTGSSGHLGEALIRTLPSFDHQVVGLDIEASAFTTHVGSITDARLLPFLAVDLLRQAISPITAIILRDTNGASDMNEMTAKTPVHLWIIGVVSLLWNAIGAFDYSATQLRLEFYMSQFTSQQLEYFYSFPAWVKAAWAVGVWGSLLGSVSLLSRKSWAVWLFGASILGLVFTTVYNFILSEGMAVMGSGGAIFTAVIWAIALLLFFYARAMAKRGVLS